MEDKEYIVTLIELKCIGETIKQLSHELLVYMNGRNELKDEAMYMCKKKIDLISELSGDIVFNLRKIPNVV